MVTRGSAQRGKSIRVEAARRGVSVYRVRLERGLRRGLSPGAAVGHAEPGEPTASDLKQVENFGSLAPVDVLQRAAIANAERELGDLPKYDPEATERRIEQIRDPDTLHLLATTTLADWQAQAAQQVPGNPFFYHGGSA